MAPIACASRSHGQQDNRYKNFILALFPSLSLLSTELSYAKAHSRQSRSADGKFISDVLSLSRFCRHGTRCRAHCRLRA